MSGVQPSSEQILAAMRQALLLAEKGPAWGANPRVGCVILSPAGEVLATGYHRGAGTAHAEVDALSKLSVEQTLGSTAVVTLEPCNHTGRTGPCAQALIKAGVDKVYYALSDPGDSSAGGAQTLTAAGIATELGPLSEEAYALNHRWFTAMRLGRPYIVAKWASTIDGRIAAEDGSSKWITSAPARIDTHQRRSQADWIVVGTGTALADNPSLTARSEFDELLPHQPRPVVLGRRELPETAKIFEHPEPVLQFKDHDLTALLELAWKEEVRTIFIEGGAEILSAFLKAELVDELLIYLAPKLLGGPKLAITDLEITNISQAQQFRFTELKQLGPDVLLVAQKGFANLEKENN